MDDMNAFERLVAGEVQRAAEPLRRVDDLALYSAATATLSPRWRFQSLSSATSFAVAGAVVALFGGLLLVAQPFARETVPWAETEGPPLLTDPAANGLIAFSRDGDIFIGDPETGESEVLIAGPETDTDPMFSPNGTSIAFRRTQTPADASGLEDVDIVIVRADGSGERVLPLEPSDGEFAGFVWSPDSRSLVVSTSRRWSVSHALVDAVGAAEARPLSAPTGPYQGDQVAWFLRPPSGDRALLSTWGVEPILAVTELGRSDVAGLAELSDLEAARAQGTSGNALEQRNEIERATKVVDPGYRGVSYAAWAPDASRIVLEAGPGYGGHPTHILVMDADGSELRLLNEDGTHPAWSPDGSSIAIVRKICCRSPFQPAWEVIVILDAETGAERLLEATASQDVGSLDGRVGPFTGWAWSPDGQSILYAPATATRPFMIDVATGKVTELPWDTDSFPSWQRVAADS